MSHNTLLVVGKDGQLGQTLFQDLLCSGVKVIGTTHHQDTLNQDSFFLDLEKINYAELNQKEKEKFLELIGKSFDW